MTSSTVGKDDGALRAHKDASNIAESARTELALADELRVLKAGLRALIEGEPEAEPSRDDYDFSNSGDVGDYHAVLERWGNANIIRNLLAEAEKGGRDAVEERKQK